MAAQVAVLTGDVVGSSDMDPGLLDAAMVALAAAAGEAAGWSGGAARFTRFRGDGWQCLAPSPALSLRAALFVQARLRALALTPDFDAGPRDPATRIAVGIGGAELPAEADLAAASGAAFRIAGRLLDAMRRGDRIALARSEDGPEPMLAALVGLCDEIARRWTPAQAAIVARALAPDAPVQEAIAREAGMSQQMVAKHLGAAGFRAVERALAAVEQDLNA